MTRTTAASSRRRSASHGCPRSISGGQIDARLKLTARQLNRATLGRQLLLRREKLPVVDAVRRVVALQAQEAASPYLALWNRITDFDPGELHQSFIDQRVVKTQLFRITLHAVAATDYPSIHEAMEPTLRGARLYDRRFR